MVSGRNYQYYYPNMHCETEINIIKSDNYIKSINSIAINGCYKINEIYAILSLQWGNGSLYMSSLYDI